MKQSQDTRESRGTALGRTGWGSGTSPSCRARYNGWGSGLEDYKKPETNVSNLVKEIEALHELFEKQEKVHKEAVDKYPKLDIRVKRALTASAVAYKHAREMIEEEFSQYKPKDIVVRVREFHATVRGLEDANKKLLKDYVATGMGNSGSYPTYKTIRKTIERKLGKFLEGEQK